jgi:LysR family transcriptional regulator, glycine cleavage system transcriptional activator
MGRHLPPLNALVAFEAAARHLSFTRAARELHVTQAAVSHQIKALEDDLGVRLFQRLNRALLLSDEGQRLLPAVREALDRIDEASRSLRGVATPRTLRVSAVPSFTARWLVPRLGRFREAHPDIDVLIAPTAELADFARGDADVGIRYGRGVYPGLRADRLLDEEMFPVCSPALLQGPRPLGAPADLRHAVLLHDEVHDDWRSWLLAAGVTGVDATRGPVFVDSSMLVQAAAEGLGVALARRRLAAAEMAAGRLVRLFDISLPVEFAYYVVSPEGTADRPKIRAFREWLLKEAAQDSGGAGG